MPGWLRGHGCRLGAIAMVLGLLTLLSSCGTSAPRSRVASDRVPVLVDTDMAADDVLALLYLVGRPDVELVGVSVVGDGVVHCPDGGANAVAVLAAAGLRDIPVACGTDRPSSGQAAFPDSWRSQADTLYGMRNTWPVPTGSPTVTGDPVTLVSSLARAHPGLRILALGPLTTVAAALRDTRVRASQPRIVVSGGAFHVPGNMPISGSVLAAAEWNIGIDPTAADQVLRSGVTTEWIPLDASNLVPIDIWFARGLGIEQRNEPGEAAQAFLRANPTLTYGGSYFWDPLASVALTDATAVVHRQERVSILTTGEEAGRTRTDSGGTSVDVAVGADPQRAISVILRAFASPVGSASAQAYTRGQATIRVVTQRGAFDYIAPATAPVGQTTFDFDATSGPGFAAVVARLAAGHTLAEVKRLIAHGPIDSIPSWVTIEAQVDVPAGSRPTWLINLRAGTHVLVAAQRDGTGMTTLGQILTR